MASLKNLVFVYGTLKTGEPNHHVLADPDQEGRQACVGKAKTVDKYPLVVASSNNIPFLLDAPGQGLQVEGETENFCPPMTPDSISSIPGELYKVDDKMLERLDVLEDIPRFYSRKEATVISDEAGEVTCWLYSLINFKPELLKSTFLSRYSASDPSLPQYIPRLDTK